MRFAQFRLKSLVLLVMVIAAGLGVYDHFYPFNRLRSGDTCSLADAMAYKRSDSFFVHLHAPYTGVLKCEYIAPSIGYALSDEPIFLNSAHINSRSWGQKFEPRLELCDFRWDEKKYSSPTVMVSKLPSLDELRSFTTVSQYVDRLGPQRGLSDGWTHSWLVFSTVDDREIEVISIFLHHLPWK